MACKFGNSITDGHSMVQGCTITSNIIYIPTLFSMTVFTDFSQQRPVGANAVLN